MLIYTITYVNKISEIISFLIGIVCSCFVIKNKKSTNILIGALDRIENYFALFYSKLSIKISNILMAASLIFVPGPNTATAPASNKN